LTQDWFRQTAWTPEVEREFFARLKRTRTQRSQKLVVQAWTLSRQSSPREWEAALALLDLFFQEHSDPLFLANAHTARAEAYLRLNRRAEAFASYREAIEAMRRYPNVINNSYIDYAWHVARLGMTSEFDSALKVLREFHEKVGNDLTFPANAYIYFGALAMMAHALGHDADAQRWASQGLAAAKKVEGPFTRHPSVGVVTDVDVECHERLRRLAEG